MLRGELKISAYHLLLSWCILLLTIADAFSSYSQRSRSGFVSLNASPKGDKSEIISALNEEFEYQGRIDVPDPDFRCGFLSLIGAANMGKSTLLNALIGEELCTATNRPQTTRHSILGVLTSEEEKVQLLFLDTPGVIGETAYKLQEGMMEAVAGAFRDADVVLVITDMFSTPIPDDELFRKLNLCDKKKIVVINKIDLSDMVNKDASKEGDQFHNSDDEDPEQLYRRTVTVEDAVGNWRNLVPDALAIIPCSAMNGYDDVGVTALRTLLCGGPDVGKAFRDLGRPIPGMFLPGVKFIDEETALDLIPVSPPLYDPDTLTDRNERFFCAELIRGVLFTKYSKELPYCCEVRIDEFREPREGDKRPIIRIKASILVERDSQKGIIVGKGGAKIKEVGVEAREKLEEFLQDKVFLNLEVKVDKNWRKDEKKLKAYGYLK